MDPRGVRGADVTHLTDLPEGVLRAVAAFARRPAVEVDVYLNVAMDLGLESMQFGHYAGTRLGWRSGDDCYRLACAGYYPGQAILVNGQAPIDAGVLLGYATVGVTPAALWSASRALWLLAERDTCLEGVRSPLGVFWRPGVRLTVTLKLPAVGAGSSDDDDDGWVALAGGDAFEADGAEGILLSA